MKIQYNIVVASILAVLGVSSTWAQTLYLPNGTGGIGTSANGNVGINTASPSALLQVGQGNGNQAFKVGISGNMANSNAEILGSLAVLGFDANNVSSIGAVAWNYYNAGSNPSWAGVLLQHNGTNMTSNGWGFSAANEGLLMFQNVNNGVIASNGANIYVSPSGNPAATFLANGKVGVGTTSPGAKLDIGQPGDPGATIINFQGNANSGYPAISFGGGVGFNFSAGQAEVNFWNRYPSAASAFQFSQLTGAGSRTDIMTLRSNGNVGIGTALPTYPLTVNGAVRAKEVIVDTGWSDYVFEKSYRLAPLSEVEQRINEDHHLPGIPSAQEVNEKGISVGQMQAKLLAKMEEMTLYVIEQEKRMNGFQQRVQQLETENAALRSVNYQP